MYYIDVGSYDNCGIDSMMVCCVYECDLEDCSDLSILYYFVWGNYVEFNCCDVGIYVIVEFCVVDVVGNVNICWLDVLVEDKIVLQCIGLEDVMVGCGDLLEGFDLFSLN